MKRRSVIAALAASALVLGACGGEDDSDESTTTGAATTEAPAEPSTGATTVPADESADDAGDETTDEESDAEVPADWPSSIVFTLTPSQEAGGLIETARPLADMLAERLGIEVEALVPTDYAGVIVALQSGQAQIAGGLGPRQMVQAEDQADAELILQAERFGSLTYVTQWMTNDPDTFCDDTPTADEDGFLFCNGVLGAEVSDGPIAQDKLALLEGETVSFVDQGSTSGYAIPALQLVGVGVDPIDGVDGVFAGGHDNSVRAVYDGDAVAGTSFNDARGTLVEEVPDVGEQVVVFGWSGPIPNDGFAVAGDLPPSLVQAITQAFVDITMDEAGLTLLQELYEIDNLVPVTSSDYDVIRQLEVELGDVLS
jgi:phosphonate transport system substrate-binding protein